MSKPYNQFQETVAVRPIDQAQPKQPWRWSTIGGALLIALAACAIYFPSLSGGFIFDDDLLLTDNALIKAPDGLFRVWYTTDQPDYVPLTSTTLWFEWRLWEMNPTGYHVSNLMLHIFACLLIWLLLRKLSIPGAFLAALLFAIHPVNVESVAWVEQRKNTLSMVFFLLSILWYLRADEIRGALEKGVSTWQTAPGTRRWYWLSLLAFALAMFSKGSVATLPLVLLLIIWWQRQRITKWDLLRVTPFLMLAVVLTPVIIWFVTHDTGEVLRNATFVQRLLGAGTVVWFYLSKAMLPIHLVLVYPQWNIRADDLPWWLPLLAAVAVTTILAWHVHSARANWSRHLLFAWTFFVVALIPILGFVDVGFMRYSLVADHYQHIAIISFLALVAAGWRTWHDTARGAIRLTATMTLIFIVSALTILSWRQNRLFADPISLYRYTLATTPDCWMIHNNLGMALSHAGQTQEAFQQYEEALQYKPHEATIHYNFGNALARAGRVDDAIQQYQQALRWQPDHVLAHYNLANNLAKIGRNQEAIEQYREAVRWQPDFAPAHVNLGNVLFNMGQTQDAIEQYQAALQISQNFPLAHFNLGKALEQIGWTEAALEHYQQALRLKPDFAEVYANLAVVCFQTHRPAEGVAMAKKGLEIARAQGNTAVVNHIEAILKSQSSQ